MRSLYMFYHLLSQQRVTNKDKNNTCVFFIYILQSKKDWNDYCKSGNKPSDIPTNPREIYKNLPTNMNSKRIPKY